MKDIITPLKHFKNCCENAPDRTYRDAKELNDLIGNAVDSLIRELRSIKLKADNRDKAYLLEARIYQYVKESNLSSSIFPLAESFGYAMKTPAKDRVFSGVLRDRDFIEAQK